MKFITISAILLASFTSSLLSRAQAESQNGTRFSVGLEGQLSRKVVTPSLFSFVIFEGNSNYRWEDSEFKADWDLRVGAPNYEANGIGFKNLYYGDIDQAQYTPLRISVGRKWLNWSEVDELWQLGQIQPLYAWDRLRPYSQGLTGIFAYTETQKFNFRFFVSYLTLPEVNPNIVIKNGQFQSKHPQSISTAPQSIAPLNVPTPLNYSLLLPGYSKILLRPSIAFQVESKPEFPLFGRFSYGYLPLTYFPPALDGGLVISEVKANISPRLMHHHVYAADLGYRFNEEWELGLGTLVDQTTNDNLASNFNYSKLGTSITTSPWLKFKSSNLKWRLAYLKSVGGLDGDVGSFAVPGQSLFSSHTYFREALMTSLDWLEPAHQEVSIIAKYMYEFSVIGHWLMLDFQWNATSHLTFIAGGDLISSEKFRSDQGGAEFLSDLRANDRIRLGVKYAF